jgi:hypothetical protein
VYIKVILEVSFYEGKRFYSAVKFNEVPNHNYLTYHFLDCLYAQKGRREGFNDPVTVV